MMISNENINQELVSCTHLVYFFQLYLTYVLYPPTASTIKVIKQPILGASLKSMITKDNFYLVALTRDLELGLQV